ncbi:MAG TPA: aminotransferase class I/II-fold pyridoxal phosphate-dependent enzyme [Solirubrobacteraceae bacterium]|nr:aminotransferase class I/II-fold pyridoxal phosphate-dependent enzyme [Solirubrobacteraceae bacterium]
MEQYTIKASNAEELVRSVEAGVARGALRPGEQLPPVRRLAAQVGLSPATVAAGIAELRRRGVVLSEQRRATRITPAPPISSAPALVPVPAGARDLSRGNPDPALLPDVRGALARCGARAHLYGEPPVSAELCALAAQKLRADGIPAEALCVVSGALDGIERVIQAHLRSGDVVAVENPGYAALYDLLRAHGLSLRAVSVDDRGMRTEELEAALAHGARAVIITPRGQNPTGAALDAERARELRELLARWAHVLVIEDDHLGALAPGRLHTSVPGAGRWAATRSVAKALGPDLRLAVLTGDELTVARVQGRQQCGPGWVSHVLQELVLALWTDPEVIALVERAGATYRRRRERFIAALAARGIDASGRSGLNVWIPVADETSTIGALLARGWVVAAGAAYRLPGSSPAVRVTIATLEGEEAKRLADDLHAVLRSGASSRSG